MKKHILVVDKDPLILYALTKALRDDGCEVKTADTQGDAVEKLSDGPYDLCLLDIQLAEVNGIILKEAINDICPETKIILMTTDLLNPLKVSQKDQDDVTPGKCFFVPKPFAICDITDVVQQVLNGDAKKLTFSDFFHSDQGKRKSRKHDRTVSDGDICYRMSVIHEGVCTRLSMEARIVDISDGGIGLLTSYPLRETQVIGFDDKMNNRVGVVAWSKMIGKERFRVGVRFA